MHGWLWEPLPETADGVPVYTDFRRWILLLRLMDDETVPEPAKPGASARIVCRRPPESPDPGERDRLTRAILAFAAGGEVPRQAEEPGGDPGDPGDPVFDFAEDGERILASFWQAYGIDLTKARMHWWIFLALLRNLPPETPFMRAVRLRTTDPGAIENDSLRREVRRAKRSVRLKKAGAL